MFSTIAGRSGRTYTLLKLLKPHPRIPGQGVYLVQCEDKPYILRKVSSSIFNFNERLAEQFGENPRLRTPIDRNQNEQALVYEYFRMDLLTVISGNPSVSIPTRRYILREVAQAIHAMHEKNWIHLDVKPDNILVDFEVKDDSDIEVQRVALADLDCALKLRGEKLLDHRIGNVMWRSPEGQAGKGIGKHSEVFSYGLLFLYVVTGAQLLHPDFEDLKKLDLNLEEFITYRLLLMLGPASANLYKLINDEEWNQMMTEWSEDVAQQPLEDRFQYWAESNLPNLNHGTVEFILKLIELDPSKRMTMDRVLSDPWWDK